MGTYLDDVIGAGADMAEGWVNTLSCMWQIVGGYTACRILLVRSVSGNGNRIPFPFISVKKIFDSSVSVHFR